MATFQWVGGYTGYEGVNSGLSANYKGSGKKVWISVWNGMTSDKGDRAFAPYHWAFTQNWRERVPSSPPLSQYLPYDLVSASRLPRGGDTVIFGMRWDAAAQPLLSNSSDMYRANIGISCLFGGCSGASTASQWAGASQAVTGDIEVVVTDDFGWGYHAQETFPSGQVIEGQTAIGWSRYMAGNLTTLGGGQGYSGIAIGNLGFDSSQITGTPQTGFTSKEFSLTGEGLVRTENYIYPLHLRFSNFSNTGRKAKCRVRQISSHVTGVASINGWQNLLRSTSPANNSNSPIAGETGNDSLLMIAGTVSSINQDQGFLSSLSYNGSELSVTAIESTENIKGMFLGEATHINSTVSVIPKSVNTSVAIHCAVPVLVTKHDTNQRLGYPGYENATVGNRPLPCNYLVGNRTDGNDQNGFTLGNWTVNPIGATTTDRYGALTPNVSMFHLSCDYLVANGGKLKPHGSVTESTAVIFRDGSIGGDVVIDLNRGSNPSTWRNGLIGWSPGDDGLRQDSEDAQVIFNLGDNIRTNGWDFSLL
jgi:hypothetical protein